MVFYICWLLSAIVGAVIGCAKGRPGVGAFWGLLLGPLGWLLVAIIPDERPKCPECLSVVPAGARKCWRCGSAIEQVTTLGPSELTGNRTWRESFVHFIYD